MSDQEKKLDHWGLLAAKLGAKCPSKEPKDGPVPDAEQQPGPAEAAPPELPAEEPPAEPAELTTHWDALADELGVAPEPKSTEPAEPPTGATQQKSSRRRRRQRRSPSQKRKKSPQAEEPVSDEDAAVDKSATGVNNAKPPTTKAEKSAKQPSETEKGTAMGLKAAKASQRSIPTWEEAVGVIVSANLQSRAKRPSGGSSRSRSKGRGSTRGKGKGVSP